MSMEAQFYEARRRQSLIDRRNSLRSDYEIPKQANVQPKTGTLQIPIRLFRHNSEREDMSWSGIPMHRSKIIHTDTSLFRRDRDIYPRAATSRRYIRGAVLLKRFSSTEYLQQR